MLAVPILYRRVTVFNKLLLLQLGIERIDSNTISLFTTVSVPVYRDVVFNVKVIKILESERFLVSFDFFVYRIQVGSILLQQILYQSLCLVADVVVSIILFLLCYYCKLKELCLRVY